MRGCPAQALLCPNTSAETAIQFRVSTTYLKHRDDATDDAQSVETTAQDVDSGDAHGDALPAASSAASGATGGGGGAAPAGPSGAMGGSGDDGGGGAAKKSTPRHRRNWSGGAIRADGEADSPSQSALYPSALEALDALADAGAGGAAGAGRAASTAVGAAAGGSKAVTLDNVSDCSPSTTSPSRSGVFVHFVGTSSYRLMSMEADDPSEAVIAVLTATLSRTFSYVGGSCTFHGDAVLCVESSHLSRSQPRSPLLSNAASPVWDDADAGGARHLSDVRSGSDNDVLWEEDDDREGVGSSRGGSRSLVVRGDGDGDGGGGGGGGGGKGELRHVPRSPRGPPRGTAAAGAVVPRRVDVKLRLDATAYDGGGSVDGGGVRRSLSTGSGDAADASRDAPGTPGGGVRSGTHTRSSSLSSFSSAAGDDSMLQLASEVRNPLATAVAMTPRSDGFPVASDFRGLVVHLGNQEFVSPSLLDAGMEGRHSAAPPSLPSTTPASASASASAAVVERERERSGAGTPPRLGRGTGGSGALVRHASVASTTSKPRSYLRRGSDASLHTERDDDATSVHGQPQPQSQSGAHPGDGVGSKRLSAGRGRPVVAGAGVERDVTAGSSPPPGVGRGATHRRSHTVTTVSGSQSSPLQPRAVVRSAPTVGGPAGRGGGSGAAGTSSMAGGGSGTGTGTGTGSGAGGSGSSDRPRSVRGVVASSAAAGGGGRLAAVSSRGGSLHGEIESVSGGVDIAAPIVSVPSDAAASRKSGGAHKRHATVVI